MELVSNALPSTESFAELDEVAVDSEELTSFDTSSVKQKVLTHIIDGFVIEESDTPFQPQTACLLTYHQLSMIRKRQQEILVREKEKNGNEDMDEVASTESLQLDNEEVATATCEQCGFSGPKSRFARPLYRFCSLMCARKYKSVFYNQTHCSTKPSVGFSYRNTKGRLRGSLSSGLSKNRKPATCRIGNKLESKTRQRKSHSASFSSSESPSFSESDESLESHDSVFVYSPSPSPDPVVPYEGNRPVSPALWSVDDVWQYIRSFPDSCQHAEDFRTQEIDGSALLLLNEEHLVESMKLPLGPALKLCAHIDRLRNKEYLK